MGCTQLVTGETCKVRIKDKFTLDDHTNFKAVFEELKKQHLQKVVVNFEDAQFIDSASLGMLLILRGECDRTGKTLLLQKPKGQIQKLFEISCCYELFSIED